MSVAPETVLRDVLERVFGQAARPALGVAVSGGSDSMALLHLTADWCRDRGVPLQAATVDHGLRAAAAGEAAMVAQVCAALGVAHRTLLWQGWDGQGNLQDRARRARRRLLTDWAADRALGTVLLGHTADDQAETVLMRLARGSGVDGLAGMDARSGLFLRPLLTVQRDALRDGLRARGVVWAEDASNDDPRFDRVRARQMLAVLAPLGLSRARLIETAGHMGRARATLWQAAAGFVASHVRAEAGDLLLDAEALDLRAGDSPGRVLAAAVQWIGGSPYRPRRDALTDAAQALRRGEARTLGGVRALPDGAGGARLTRELAAAAGPVAVRDGTALWDGRWRVTGPGGAAGAVVAGGAVTGGAVAGGAMADVVVMGGADAGGADVGGPDVDGPDAGGADVGGPEPGGPEAGGAEAGGAMTVGALGEAGLAVCRDWRGTGLPRGSLLASPAVWQAGRLIAAPVAGFAAGWQASLCLPFDRFIVSH